MPMTMIYKARLGQQSYGVAIGILLLETFVPFIPGDVANASTYEFPVRFQKVEGFTTDRAIGKDESISENLLQASKKLERDGVRAITGDCGFMAIHQRKIARNVNVPVFLSSLLQIPFICSIISERDKIGIITADSGSLDASVLEAVGIKTSKNLVIRGLQYQDEFARAVIEEEGSLDPKAIEREVVFVARTIIKEDPGVKAILLECSCLPPYGTAVQEALGLPVFDYITMINYVYSAVVKRRFEGFM